MPAVKSLLVAALGLFAMAGAALTAQAAPQTPQEAFAEVGPLAGRTGAGRTGADIINTLTSKGWKGVTANSGGQVFTKDLGNGTTAVIRLDPSHWGGMNYSTGIWEADRPHDPRYAGEWGHAHKESVPTDQINAVQTDPKSPNYGKRAGDGNYWWNAPGKQTYNDANQPTASNDFAQNHIPTKGEPYAPVPKENTLPVAQNDKAGSGGGDNKSGGGGGGGDQNGPDGPPPESVRAPAPGENAGGNVAPPGDEQKPPSGPVAERPSGPVAETPAGPASPTGQTATGTGAEPASGPVAETPPNVGAPRSGQSAAGPEAPPSSGGTRTASGPTGEPGSGVPQGRSGVPEGPAGYIPGGFTQRVNDGQIDFAWRRCIEGKPERACQREDCDLERCRQKNDHQGMLDLARRTHNSSMENAVNIILDGGACIPFMIAARDCDRTPSLPDNPWTPRDRKGNPLTPARSTPPPPPPPAASAPNCPSKITWLCQPTAFGQPPVCHKVDHVCALGTKGPNCPPWVDAVANTLQCWWRYNPETDEPGGMCNPVTCPADALKDGEAFDNNRFCTPGMCTPEMIKNGSNCADHTGMTSSVRGRGLDPACTVPQRPRTASIHPDVLEPRPAPPPPEIALGSPGPAPKASEPPPEIALGSPPERPAPVPAAPQPEPWAPSINGGQSATPMPGPAASPADPWSPPSVPQVNIAPPMPPSVPPVNIGPPLLVPPAPGPGPSHPNKPIVDTWTPPMGQHTPPLPSPDPVVQPKGGTASRYGASCIDGTWIGSDGRKLGPCDSGSKQAGSGQAKGAAGSGTKQANLPVKPVAPQLPVKPVTPQLPVKPVAPVLPVKPAMPVLPVAPVQQALPVKPAEPPPLSIAKVEPRPAPGPKAAPAPSPQPAKQGPSPGQQAKREEPKPAPVKPECRKGNVNFHFEESEAVSVPVTIIGGAKCTNVYKANNSTVHLTEASISAEPSNGTLTQTGDFAFEYRPEPGFKGSDEYAIEVCGEGRRASGCSILTYEITLQ